MKKRLIISLVLILLLSTYSMQNNFKFSKKINIQELLIENNIHVEEDKIKEKLLFYMTRTFSF